MAAAMLNDQEIDFEVAGHSINIENESARKRKREDSLETRKKIDKIEVKISKLENLIKKQEENLREIKALLHYICNQKKNIRNNQYYFESIFFLYNLNSLQ